MSDTSGLPNTDAEGVPAEDDPQRFEDGQQQGDDKDAQAGEPAEPPPADFDPAEQPSNPDLVKNTEPPD